MANIQFTAIHKSVLTADELAIIGALEEAYETGGGATHTARTDLHELCVAFRPYPNTILILVVSPDASVVKRDWGKDVVPSPSEYMIPADQAQLERGIEGKPSLLG